MRYYLYLDKDFLRSLFSIFECANFNIDVFEFSVRNSYTINNNLSLDPSVECGKDIEDSSKKDWKENFSSSARDNHSSKKRIGVSYDNGNSYNFQTEKKYLNISDITDMKNMAFYHDLLEKIRENNCRNEDSRIIVEVGFIKTNSNRSIDTDTDNFFMINDSFIWYDKTKLQGNIELLKEMSCKIKVVGYKMNCKEDRNNYNNHILKAIAIYIE